MSEDKNNDQEIIIPSHIRKMSDGRLLLVGGNHGVERMFNVKNPIAPERQVSVFLENNRTRMAWTSERGISYSQWVFPDPIMFQGVMPLGSVRSIFEASVPLSLRGGNIHYPLSLLDKFPDRQSRTDSHYSLIGNMYLSAEVARHVLSTDFTEEVNDLYSRRSLPVSFTGDLGVQCNPKISEYRSQPPRLEDVKSASNGVQSGNMGIIHLVHSPNAKTKRTLMIFGDSFFRSMLPELARYWEKIVFFRTQFFHIEMISSVMPDDILCGLAERYFATTQPDTIRPHFLAYPLISGRRTSPEEGFASLWGEMINSNALAVAEASIRQDLQARP